VSALPPIAATTTSPTAALTSAAAPESGLPGLFAQLLAALSGGPTESASVKSAFDGEPAVPPTPPATSSDLAGLLELLDKFAKGQIDDPNGEYAEAGLAEIQLLLAGPALPPNASGLAARAEGIAADLAPVSPSLSEALAALAAKMRGEKPAPQIPQADVPELPPESAKAQASDLPPRAPPQPPIKADLPPPVASPRSEAVPKAAVDPVEPAPVKSGGSERVLADIRFDATLTPRPVLAAAAPQAVNLDLPALAVEIVRHVHAGLDRFQIRLDPPDLGRIDVRIDLDGDRAALKLTVEKSETLDLLQRDARALERALTQAGFNGDRPNLEFALRQQNQQMQDAESSAPPFTAAEAAPLAQRLIVRAGGIDLYA